MNYEQRSRLALRRELLSGFLKRRAEFLKRKPAAEALLYAGTYKGVDAILRAAVLNVANKDTGSRLPFNPASGNKILVRGANCIWMYFQAPREIAHTRQALGWHESSADNAE
jgi:hypothetical protein